LIKKLNTNTLTAESQAFFAYNGMLKDDEIQGVGNSYTTEFRQYDARLGKWTANDPLMNQFPWMSPYCGFDNNPILLKDPKGLESGPAKEPYHNSFNPAPKNVKITERYSCDKIYTYKLDNGELHTLDPIEGQARMIKVNNTEYKATYSTNPDKAGQFIGYYSTDGKNTKFTPRIQYGYAWNYLTEEYNTALGEVLKHWYNNSGMYGYEDTKGKQYGTFFKSNYNCFELSQNFVRDIEPNYTDGIMTPGEFNQDLRDNFENVKQSEIVPGRTIIRMAKDGNLTHACVFLGFDINKNMIILTKNDASAQPRIMLLKELMMQRPDYGIPQGAFEDKYPYYNILWEAR
jgi:RHS repeat-associated protein